MDVETIKAIGEYIIVPIIGGIIGVTFIYFLFKD